MVEEVMVAVLEVVKKVAMVVVLLPWCLLSGP